MAFKLNSAKNRIMCHSKKKFNETQAKEKAILNKQRYYKCPLCTSYHLTSNIGEIY